ncbi:ubiquitin-specific protease 39, partial [Volvox carteri f. nagariensis]
DEDDDDDDEGADDRVLLPRSTSRAAVKKGTECPYLDTISRQNLDFDFEKCCSVTLSPVNVYVCLVCGKYFQGRGLNTHAYTHSLESAHHMFMKLDNGKVYCLPDNYEVLDKSLDDIRHVRDPLFRTEEIASLDNSSSISRLLSYMPGLVGLNNMKNNDYINVIMQICARITPLRDFFLDPANYSDCRSPLVQRFGELLRKMWNTRNFKGQVSPHEFVQAVRNASKKRFTADTQCDPVELWSWLLNNLHLDLTRGKPKKPSIITQCLQGELEVTTLAGTGRGTRAATSGEDVTERVPFLLLGLELPPAPLFKDVLEKNIIPQVPIFHIMRKFDGETITDDIRAGRRRFRITRLPRYLALHYRRFTKNNFFIEKNPTLVNFPVKSLELRDILPLPEFPAAAGGAAAGAPDAAAYGSSSKYDLVANLVHDGKADSGTYRVHVHRKVEDIWYEVQDLAVQDILPQMVALSEAYFQVFE